VTVIVPPLGVWHERDLPLGSFLQPLSSHCFHSRPSAYHPVIISRGSPPSAGTWRAIWLPAPSLQDSLGSHSFGPWRSMMMTFLLRPRKAQIISNGPSTSTPS